MSRCRGGCVAYYAFLERANRFMQAFGLLARRCPTAMVPRHIWHARSMPAWCRYDARLSRISGMVLCHLGKLKCTIVSCEERSETCVRPAVLFTHRCLETLLPRRADKSRRQPLLPFVVCCTVMRSLGVYLATQWGLLLYVSGCASPKPPFTFSPFPTHCHGCIECDELNCHGWNECNGLNCHGCNECNEINCYRWIEC